MNHRRGWVLIGIGIVLLVAGSLGWAAIGPSITKACQAPSLRPGDRMWVRTDTKIGVLNGPGDVLGSATSWVLTGRTFHGLGANTTMPPTLQLVVMDAVDGELGPPNATVRGNQARFEVSPPLPGFGPGYSVTWHEDRLGCADYSLYLVGDDVTADQAVALANSLH